jgi:putative phosphoesterase
VIAIIGDTHLPRGNRRLPDSCLDLLREAELILHTGDLTTLAALEELGRFAPTRAVYGNADDAAVQAKLPARLELEHGGMRLALVHGGGARVGRHERLRKWFPDADLVAYGHSHHPEVARADDCWIVNPGSPTDRRREPAHTMVLVEDGAPRLVEL